MRSTHIIPVCAFVAASSLLLGCWYGTSDIGTYQPGPTTTLARIGQLTVDWTVDGSTDPRACDDLRADSMQIVVYDRGSVVANQAVPCNAFGVTLSLPPGYFRAEATLIDWRGGAASTTLPLEDLEVTEGTNLTVTTDFPRNAFY